MSCHIVLLAGRSTQAGAQAFVPLEIWPLRVLIVSLWDLGGSKGILGSEMIEIRPMACSLT